MENLLYPMGLGGASSTRKEGKKNGFRNFLYRKREAAMGMGIKFTLSSFSPRKPEAHGPKKTEAFRPAPGGGATHGALGRFPSRSFRAEAEPGHEGSTRRRSKEANSQAILADESSGLRRQAVDPAGGLAEKNWL